MAALELEVATAGQTLSTTVVNATGESDTVIEMRAFVRVAAENQAVVEADVEIPPVGSGEVLVALRSFGVGIHDRYFIPPDGPFPYTIGVEGAGVVEELGPDVDSVQVGDRVMVSSSMSPKGGTWAQYVVVGAHSLTPIPETMDFPTAAGVPVAGGSAVDSVAALALGQGDTLFVAGASGAIGTLVVQIAATRGVRVIGSASAVNHEYLLALGAEAAVDYHDVDWPAQVRDWAAGGVDAALAIQPGTGADAQKVVRDGGRVVTVSGDAGSVVAQRGISVEQFQHRGEAARADMAQLINDIASGQVRLVLEHVYPFDEAMAALEKTETRHARGKLAVAVPVPA